MWSEKAAFLGQLQVPDFIEAMVLIYTKGVLPRLWLPKIVPVYLSLKILKSLKV